MKKYVLASCFAAVALLISSVSIAQTTTKPAQKATKEKSVTKETKKEKMNEYEEIIIKRKGDKDGKVTIEIKDGEVKVNGKTIDDYDDANISVRRRTTPRIAIAASPSRFRSADAFGHGGSWNYSGDAEMFYSNSNRAFLGVSSEEEDGGAKIISVTENSAAAKAGLKKGDVITKIGEHDVDGPSDLTKAIGKFKPEEKVTIVYKRDGKEVKTTATLGKNKSSVSSFGYMTPGVDIAPMAPMQGFEWNDKGGQHYFGNMRPRLGIKAQDTEEGKGVKVLDVADESLAEKAGIKEGDIITEFDGKTINSADELAEAAQEAKEKSSMKVQLTRDGKSQTVEIKIPKKLKTANL